MLTGFEERRAALSELGVSIVAATSQTEEDVAPVAAELGFPVGYGVTPEQADAFGGWWEARRDHVQPSEFVLTQAGRVLSSNYSSSPVGRMDPEETLVLMKILASRAR